MLFKLSNSDRPFSEETEKTMPRENIISILNSSPLSKAVCMVAPFGYGKTKAVVSWLKEKDIKCIFFSFCQEDNEKENFFSRFQKETLPSFDGSGEELREAFTSKLRKSGKKSVLVLDNLHYITETTLLIFIKELVDSLLGVCRVIILTRLELSPVFNDLILRGCVRLVTADELAFNKTEIESFFKNEGYELENQIITEIALKTGGWPAALNAVLASSFNEDDFFYNDRAKDYVNNFFETHIWGGLPQAIRGFMLKTSVLDTFSYSLCYAVSENETAPKTLEWIKANGLFLDTEKNRREYYYHPAFKEFLLKKLEKSGIEINALYIKAAWWMYENKKYKKAFYYFYKTNFFYGLDKMLKEFNPANMPIAGFLEMTECITELNPYSLEQYPNILAKMALIEFLKGNAEKMKEFAAVFHSWVEPGRLSITPKEYAELYWEEGWLLYINPDVSQLENKRLVDFNNYKNYAPHLEDLHIARAAVLGFASNLRGVKDFSSIVHVIEPYVKKLEASCTEDEEYIVYCRYAILEIRLMLAEYLYETERITEALDAVNKILPETGNLKHAHLYFICITLLIKIMKAMGNTDGIDELLELCENKITEKNSFFLLPNFHAVRQHNYILSGNKGFIKVFYDENKREAEKDYYYLLYRKIVYSRVLLSLGKRYQALIVLNGLERLCEKYRRVLDLIEVCCLKASALYRLGDEENALCCLKKAVDIGEPYGYIRIFSDDAEELLPILTQLEKKAGCIYLKKIIISAKKSVPKTLRESLKKNSRAELTKTELKILKALQNNMSYNEISLEFDIKISTVRTHIQSVYGKLGVNNRTAAVLQAEERGIISKTDKTDTVNE